MMSKIELNIVYHMDANYKDERTIEWKKIDINEAYKIACEIVAGARPEISTIIANSDMADIWIYDDDGDIKVHWYYHDTIDEWIF